MPLPEVIAASLGISSSGDKAERVYCKLLSKLGAEAEILRVRSLGDIEKAGGERIAEGIRRLREERVIKTAGYDGETLTLYCPGFIPEDDGLFNRFHTSTTDEDGTYKTQDGSSSAQK